MDKTFKKWEKPHPMMRDCWEQLEKLNTLTLILIDDDDYSKDDIERMMVNWNEVHTAVWDNCLQRMEKKRFQSLKEQGWSDPKPILIPKIKDRTDLPEWRGSSEERVKALALEVAATNRFFIRWAQDRGWI